MKRPVARLAILLAVVAAAFAATTGAASASACGQRVIDDWYGSATGQLRHIYPIHCYREALGMLRTDLEVYSNAREDITRAMNLAIALGKNNGKGKGPGGGGASPAVTTALPSFLGGPDAKDGGKPPTEAAPHGSQPPGPIPYVLHASSPSSVPLPAIILGAIAALLLVLGATAYLARRRQQRRQTLRPRHANGRTP